MKTCRVCGTDKALKLFMRNAKAKDGRSSRCHACVLELLKTVRQRRRLERNEQLLAAGGKKCHACGETLPAERFTPRAASVDGLASSCRKCLQSDKRRRSGGDPEYRARRAASAKAYYWRNAEKRRLYSREYTKTHPDESRAAREKCRAHQRVHAWQDALIYTATHRAKVAKYGESNIDASYLLELFEKQNGRCYWLGIPMVPSAIKRDPRRPSIDRLDNTKGYVQGNVVLACQFANMGRSQATAEQFSTFVSELIAAIRVNAGERQKTE